MKPTRNIIVFFAYVSFFPQLVAGPIERATNLLPQFLKQRKLSYLQASDGMKQILWGLFKKIVIADNCAIFVNDIFSNYELYSGSTLLLGAFFFAMQIYGDFSGYSDIAIGTARLFGFNLMQNFAFPYFSRDIAEFWRRWHISLSTWFRDYVYIPLGGSRVGTALKIRNVFVIFIVSGFWHGANWTFIVWGLLNALYFLPIMLSNKNRAHMEIISKNRYIPPLVDVLKIGITFGLTLFAWIFFRAESILHAFSYISLLISNSLFRIPDILPQKLLLIIIVFILIEWVQRDKKHALELIHTKFPLAFRWICYYLIVYVLFAYGASPQEFIYFQF